MRTAGRSNEGESPNCAGPLPTSVADFFCYHMGLERSACDLPGGPSLVHPPQSDPAIFPAALLNYRFDPRKNDRMKKRTWAIALLLGLAAYLGLWPVPVQPVSWKAPPAPGYSGPHAVNERLANLQIIPLGLRKGPSTLSSPATASYMPPWPAAISLRMNPDGSAQEVFANTGGRVLGFDFDAKGNLVAADAIKGLLSISPEGNIAVLADAVGGDPIRYADAVVVASTGRIYFSDASTRFAPRVWGGTFEASILDIVEQSSTGRILEYDPASKGVRIVARGLSFANGVALSKDEQSLFVNETGKYRVWKIAVESDNLDVTRGGPQAVVLFDNLPGYPDNLMRGLDGKIWLGFAKPRNPSADAVADKPFLRKLALRLPRALWPVPVTYGHVLAFTEDGNVVADLQDPTGAYPDTTGVTETPDRLYVQSLHANGLGWLPR